MSNKVKTKRNRIKIVNKAEPMLVYSTSYDVNKYCNKSDGVVIQSCNN